MEEWKKVKLGEIGKIVGGATPSTKDRHNYDGNIAWITPKDLSTNKNRYISCGERMISQKGLDSCSCSMLPPGSILFSSRAPIGYVAIAANELCTNQGFKSIVVNKEIADNIFIYYLLIYNRDYIAGLGSGTTFMEVSGKTMSEIQVSLPPLPVQKHIANILSSLDDKIELNRRINDNLEQQAQALFKSWFVDFEPWGGKMPDDWREDTVSNLVDLLNGYAFKSSDFIENGKYYLITIKGVQDGRMIIEGADRLDVLPDKMPQWCLLQRGDILLSLTGNVGRCCIVDVDECLLNQRVAKIRPKNDYNKLFAYVLFRQNEMKAQMISISRGTAQMNLSPIETGNLTITIPSDEVLKDFGGRYNHIIDTILNKREESRRLAQLRDTLLPKLMSGELKIS